MSAFPEDIHQVDAFLTVTGKARTKRYLDEFQGDQTSALRLYIWNAKISQAFYLPLQIWEICLRNRVNDFLCWKYGNSWPYDERNAVRQMKSPAQRSLRDAIDKQSRARGARPSTDSIVADLSAGFWVQFLSQGYAVPFQWRYNLPRIFPTATNSLWRAKPAGFDMSGPHSLCESVVELRNRVAHHEPLAWMDLQHRYFVIGVLIYAMSEAAYSYMESHSVVPQALGERPSKK